MRNTLANVTVKAREAGLIPIQIDGIPEGFSYITPILQVGDNIVGDDYIAFLPMTDKAVKGETIEELVNEYNLWQNK